MFRGKNQWASKGRKTGANGTYSLLEPLYLLNSCSNSSIFFLYSISLDSYSFCAAALPCDIPCDIPSALPFSLACFRVA